MAKKPKKKSNQHNARGPQLPRRSDDAPRMPDGDDEESGTVFGAWRNVDLSQLSADLGDEFEVVGAEDDLDDLGEPDLATLDVLPTLSLEAVLQQLARGETLPPERELRVFSDLSRRDMETVAARWGDIATDQRRAVAEALVLVARDELSWVLGRFLRVLLNDADAVVRETAVRGLWDDDDSALIGPLVQMLRDDPATAVRAAAATALGTYVLAGELEELEAAPAMRAEEALLAVLHDEREPLAVRRRALESVAYSSETGVHQLIEDAYYSPHEEMRISALFAMGRSADVRWRSLARAELRNPSAAVRAEAALACGELEANAALDDLLALLGDRHAPVRMAAIFALGRIGGNDARDALETVLLSDSAEEVEAAQEALEEMTFFADAQVGLFDESLDEDDEWESDRADDWYDMDDRELGEYEDDDAYADDDDDGESDDDE